MKNIYRHGDIVIKEITEFPKNLKRINNPILAYGEATGHHHKLVKEAENQFSVLEDNAGNKYLQINEPTDLVHQEHKTITIEKGLYFISHEREYNYFELERQLVVD
jgi:hypothetical protein